jgi:hypothetical protein
VRFAPYQCKNAKSRILKNAIHTFLPIEQIPSEGWGQLNTTDFELTRMVKSSDPTRPVLSVTGFYGRPEIQFILIFLSEDVNSYMNLDYNL